MACNNCNSNPCSCTTMPRGARGARGEQGLSGSTPNSDIYQFSTSLIGNPASGIVSVNNANVLSATNITINTTDFASNNMAAWLARLNVANTNTKAFVTIFNKANPIKFVDYIVTAYSLSGSVVTLTVVGLGGSGSTPFANNDSVLFSFVINGANGVIVKNNDVAVTPPAISANTSGVPTTIGTPRDMSNVMVNNGDVMNITAAFTTTDSTIHLSTNNTTCYLEANGIFVLTSPVFTSNLQKIVLRMQINRIDATNAFVIFSVECAYPVLFPPYSFVGNVSGVDWTSFMITALGSINGTMSGQLQLFQLEIEYKAKA